MPSRPLPTANVYDSPRLARAYAHSRPLVHRLILAAVERRLRGRLPPPAETRALDIGCGAGLSTAALAPFARTAVGLDPTPAMLAHRREVAPDARFVVGCAEQLPFRPASFEILTAAGSLNYADLDAFLPEAARVMTADGLLVIYDFSAGRCIAGDPRLDAWFGAFERRYPYPPHYALDARALPYHDAGLRLASWDAFEVAAPMTADAYLAYVLSETNVEQALRGGTEEEDITAWCRATLAAAFPPAGASVLVTAYVAIVVGASA